jgi:hypothetical protein
MKEDQQMSLVKVKLPNRHEMKVSSLRSGDLLQLDSSPRVWMVCRDNEGMVYFAQVSGYGRGFAKKIPFDVVDGQVLPNSETISLSNSTQAGGTYSVEAGDWIRHKESESIFAVVDASVNSPAGSLTALCIAGKDRGISRNIPKHRMSVEYAYVKAAEVSVVEEIA